MSKNKLKYRNLLSRILLAVFILMTVIIRTDSIGQDMSSYEDDGWQIMRSVYFTIYVRPTANLRKIERRLERRYFYSTIPKLDFLAGPEEKITYRLDRIFKRARDILDMRPPNMHIKVRIYDDKDELQDVYYEIFKQYRDVKSFYIYRKDTIYTSETDISDSVMAHEMGHAIVDHYFVVHPPEKVKEMLAGYVDMHLDD